ncbi:MAG: PAS domain-containing protein [Janthinobacterium lividum]
MLPVFNAQPGATLLLTPDWVIVGASDDYLAATLTERDTIVGQHIFDAFPDNPQTPEANAVANVRASLIQVQATKQPHKMDPQHYDVPDRTQPGRFVERYWQPCHTPVLDAAGQVQFIIQSVQDITASRLAERRLRESQASEQAARAEADQEKTNVLRLFEQVTVAIALLQGPDYRVALANPEMLCIWGRTPAQALNQPVFAALPEIASQGFEAIFADVLQHGTPYDLQEVPVRIDRGHTDRPTLGYFHLMYRPQHDAQGRITGIITMAVEVTEQVQARQHLEQLNQELEARVQARTHEVEAARATTERQRRQWEELFRTAPAGIAIFDGPEWVCQFANPGYQAMFPGRQLLGKRLVDALPEVADQPLVATLHHVYDTGEPFQTSEMLLPMARAEDGPIEDKYFDLSYLVRRNEAGQIDGFVTYAHDVTEQVHARREREDQRQRLQRLFMEAPAAICILSGPDLVYELVNSDYQALFPGRELLGKPILAALPEIADNAVYATLRQVYDMGRTHEEQALLIPLARPTDGVLEDRYFRYIQQARYTADGRIDGVLVFAFEVTEQVRIRRQVQDLNEELTATNQELGESNAQLTRTNVDLDTFVYTASHDLKAPITNIEGILLALRAQLPAEVQQDKMVAQLLHMLQGTVTRFQLTISQLTDITKLQLAHTGPAEPVQLAPVVEDVRLDLAPLLAAAATALTVEVAPDLVVSFSPANLRSIVYNLLSNAIKYRSADRPSQVRVQATSTPQAVVLTVQDNGLGMSSVQQRQLFGLFQRLHTHVEGTGVGLYIVKRLVENGGGTISVHSQPDVGTTFTVTFPLSAA